MFLDSCFRRNDGNWNFFNFVCISEGFGRFHFNDKLTFYERCGASLDELKNHFHEALGNKYIGEARDSYEGNKNNKRPEKYSSPAKKG